MVGASAAISLFTQCGMAWLLPVTSLGIHNPTLRSDSADIVSVDEVWQYSRSLWLTSHVAACFQLG